MANRRVGRQRNCEALRSMSNVRKQTRGASYKLNIIPLAWPFAQWGLDMIGPLCKSSNGGYTRLLVAVDKFTKWIEAAPVTTQDAETVVKFIRSIVHRFGVPHSIITDNGTNFTAKEFQDYYDELGINVTYASVSHP